jgi:ParB family chromosome partitioning protein
MERDTNGMNLRPAPNLNLFESTNPDKQISIVNIDITKLKHYKKHPFKLYKGQRLDDMVESIKANGIITPIIIRKEKSNTPIEYYEVLSGHNRLEAGKLANLIEIPCIIKDFLTDDEAHLYVTETNLMQRSFSDLSHSERALSLAQHYEAVKTQGKRNDLIEEIKDLLSNDGTSAESQLKFKKADKRDKVAEKYGLKRDTVARYIRINSLNKDLKDLLDDGEISLGAAYNFAFLKLDEQEMLFLFLIDNEIKPSIKQSEAVKELSHHGDLTETNLENCFKIKDKPKKENENIQIKRKSINSYFHEEDTKEDIESTIIKALKFYFINKDKQIDENSEEQENATDFNNGE